jgi:hypothetical protein
VILAGCFTGACAWRLPWQEPRARGVPRPDPPLVVNVLAAVEALLPELASLGQAVEGGRGKTLDPPYADRLTAAVAGTLSALKTRSDALRQAAGAASAGGGRPAVEEAARQLDAATVRARALLGQGRRPMLSVAPLLLSGFDTLAAELRREPLAPPTPGLWLAGFRFDDQLPGVVPAQGGRFALTGGGWWEGEVPPELWLYDAGGLYLRKLPLQPEGRGGAAAMLDADTLAANAGGCMELRLRAFRPGEVRGQPGRWLEQRLPACIAPPFAVTLEVAAGVRAGRTRIEQTELPDRDLKRFAWQNDQCPPAEPMAVSGVHTWPAAAAGGRGDCRIVAFQTLDERRQGEAGAINLALGGPDTIVAGGLLGPADCSGKRALPAVWAASVRPTVECRQNEHSRHRAAAPPAAFRPPSTRVCVEIPVRSGALAEAHWSMVTPVVNGLRFDPLALSPDAPAEELMLAGPVAPVEGVLCRSELEPGGAGGPARVCVTVGEP